MHRHMSLRCAVHVIATENPLHNTALGIDSFNAANATGFSISGGTTSKTLTVGADYTLGSACTKSVTDNSSNKA